jgi:hypothetical protein
MRTGTIMDFAIDTRAAEIDAAAQQDPAVATVVVSGVRIF